MEERLQTSTGPRIRLPHFGRIVNIYYNLPQRTRFLATLAPGDAHTAVVIAARREDWPELTSVYTAQSAKSAHLTFAELPRDWHRGLAMILDGVLHAQASHKNVLLVADFDGLVPQHAVAEAEALLGSLMREWPASYITQYDGRTFQNATDLLKLRENAWIVMGDYFYQPRAQSRSAERRDEVHDDATEMIAD